MLVVFLSHPINSYMTAVWSVFVDDGEEVSLVYARLEVRICRTD